MRSGSCVLLRTFLRVRYSFINNLPGRVRRTSMATTSWTSYERFAMSWERIRSEIHLWMLDENHKPVGAHNVLESACAIETTRTVLSAEPPGQGQQGVPGYWQDQQEGPEWIYSS